jgi:hypothetical protein
VTDQLAPTIVANVGTVPVGPLQQLTVTYLSGTVSNRPNFASVNAGGNLNHPANDGDGVDFGTFPS